jgi:hypothetical protein
MKSKINLFLLFSFLSSGVLAATPKPGQIAHHQATRLKVRRLPFTQKGSIQVGGKVYKTKLSWYGVSNYDFVIEALPSALTSMAGVSGSWTLQRRPSKCSLTAGRRVISCGLLQFWPMFEFSAMPEMVGPSLVRAGIFSRDDIELTQTHAKDTVSYADKRVKIVVGRNGDKPMAALEVRSPDADVFSETTPLIHFEQNFLAPIYAQFLHEGAPYEIRAQSNYKISRDQPRYSHVIAENVSVLRGGQLLAAFKREKLDFDRKLRPTKFTEGLVDINSFKESLSDDGENLASALFVTH